MIELVQKIWEIIPGDFFNKIIVFGTIIIAVIISIKKITNIIKRKLRY